MFPCQSHYSLSLSLCVCARLALTWAHHDREDVVYTREEQVRACVLIVSCLKAYDEGAVRDFLLGALLSLSLSIAPSHLSRFPPRSLAHVTWRMFACHDAHDRQSALCRGSASLTRRFLQGFSARCGNSVVLRGTAHNVLMTHACINTF